MAIELILALKVITILVVFLLHVVMGRWIRAVILTSILYFALPTPDDALWMPVAAMALGIPILIFPFLVYGIAWLLLFLIWRFT